MPTVFSWAYSRNNPTSPSNQVQGIWSYFEVLDHWELSFVQAKDPVSSFYVELSRLPNTLCDHAAFPPVCVFDLFCLKPIGCRSTMFC